MPEAWSFIGAVVLALAHLVSGKINVFHGSPRSGWLSFGGGIAVAYVFVHFLPELSELQSKVEVHHGSSHWYWRHHLYLVGVAGLAAFFSVEVAAKRTKQVWPDGEERSASTVFWPHLGLLVVYTGFLGYFLVHRASEDWLTLLIFVTILALHLISNDRALRDDYGSLYQGTGCWTLAGGVIAGWILGRVWVMPELTYGIVLAVMAGGVTLNAIKEELPPEQGSRILPFLLGSVGCALALAAIQ